MKILNIKGRQVFVDDKDFKNIKMYSWCISVSGYAVARVAGKVVYLHRLLLKVPKGQLCDHINGNRLDNRRDNLRVCTARQNAQNQGIKKSNKSGFKGVSWDKRKQKWVSRIRTGKLYKFLGYFDDVNLAAQAYSIAAEKYHGNFMRLV